MELWRSTRVFGLALLTALAFSSSATAAAEAATAPRWQIEGAMLEPTEKRNFIANSIEGTLISVPGALSYSSPNGECVATGKIVGSGALTPGKKEEVTLVCTKTTVVGKPTCTVHSPGQEVGTIILGPLKSTLVWTSEEGAPSGDLFVPEAGAVLGELVVEGTCVKVTNKIEKELIGLITPIKEETMVATQTFQEPAILSWWTNANPPVKETITQLTVGGKTATFRSRFSFSLNPEKEVGVFPG